jgi:hypothetical protein
MTGEEQRLLLEQRLIRKVASTLAQVLSLDELPDPTLVSQTPPSVEGLVSRTVRTYEATVARPSGIVAAHVDVTVSTTQGQPGPMMFTVGDATFDSVLSP